MEKRRQQEQEKKKKQIADYKQKKAIATEMLANADLEDYYDEYDNESGGDDVENNEGDASKYLDRMINQYAQRKDASSDIDLEAELLQASSSQAPSRRPPPAVM